MVFINNKYELRDYLLKIAKKNSYSDPFKSEFFHFLGLSNDIVVPNSPDEPALYQKCAIAGLGGLKDSLSENDIKRLLKHSAKIDLTPSPWSTDMICLMAIKWLVEKTNNSELKDNFTAWISSFLPALMVGDHFTLFEKDIGKYLIDEKSADYDSAVISLFFHYQNIKKINDQKTRYDLITRFMAEFQTIEETQQSIPTAVLSLSIYVFNQVNLETDVIPPTGWSSDNLVKFLENIQNGLKRWTWETKPKTRGQNAEAVKWPIENEYHVQNLLYCLLAPLFSDLKDEENIKSIGPKKPRLDFYLPSLHTIIEVKYRKDTNKSFRSFIDELSADKSLYLSDPTYDDAKLICFMWDHTCSTEEHNEFKSGILKVGFDACIIVNSPVKMRNI